MVRVYSVSFDHVLTQSAAATVDGQDTGLVGRTAILDTGTYARGSLFASRLTRVQEPPSFSHLKPMR